MEALSLRCCAASTFLPLYSRNPRLSVAPTGQRTSNLVHSVAKTTDAESCNGVRSKQGLPDSEGSSNRNKQVREGFISIAAGALLGIAVGTLAVSAPTALANFLSYDHAEMRGADLSQQDLRGAVFAGSNLDNTTDTFAGFQGANLKNTSWVRALADRVVFRSSNLQNANFTNAILSGSQFEDADITGADFSEAIVDKFQRLKMCKKATGVNPVTGVETRESLFC